jgi:hypothetical protein
MLKINNSVLKINGDWLNPVVRPVPPGPSGQWYDLATLHFTDFIVNESDDYHIKNSDNVETYTQSETMTTGYINLYKAISIPAERRNDDYLLLEFPLIPWRTSDNANLVYRGSIDSTAGLNMLALAVNRKFPDYYKHQSYILSTASGSKPHATEAGQYSVRSWTNQIYRSSDNVQIGTYSIDTVADTRVVVMRYLYDLHTNNLYYEIGNDLSDEIVLSNFTLVYTVSDFGTDKYYNISILSYSNGAKAGIPWLFAGHATDGFKLKSYKGTL